MRKLVITAGILSVANAAGAAPTAVTGPEIANLVSGTIVEIDTPLGKKISVRYVAGGRLSGSAGELASYLGASSDTGRWWVEGNRLCNKWLKWFEAEAQCLELKRNGDRILWQNQSGTSGTATIVANTSAKPAGKMALASSSPMRLAGPNTAARPARETGAPAMPATKAAATSPAVHRVANVGAEDVLNVRHGPSADDAVVGTLKPETRGIALSGECRARWCPISHAGLSGWVNVAYLEPETAVPTRDRAITSRDRVSRDSRDAPRTCLTEPARALLDTIEGRFGPVRTISTCRAGATIAGTGRPSRHASGNAIDFDAGSRKAQIIDWLVANHKAGGTMTYPDMDHIHVDVGRHFVSLAGKSRRASRGGRDVADWSRDRMGLSR